jgi:hypothetical protein
MSGETDRIDEIRRAVKEYGRRSAENMEICRRLGRAIIVAFDRYLTLKGSLVFGVPPFGDWSPEKGDYRDATFSFHGSRTLRIEDVQFGMALRVDNLDDSGCLWLRIVVNLRKQGEKIGVFVNEDSDGIWIPTNYSDRDLSEICEALYQLALRAFREDARMFVEGSGQFGTIGFMGGRYR